MTGTLELLCGPSGVGKTSSIDGAVKSYRWTTRAIRDGEIDSCEYNGSTSTHGFFVSEEEFVARASRGELVGVHRYPDPENGNWYGFPKREMEEALARGDELSEQIVRVKPIEELLHEFKGKVTPHLFLGTLRDIKKRIKDLDDYDVRMQTNAQVIFNYVRNLHFFVPHVTFSFSSIVSSNNRQDVLDDIVEKIETNQEEDIEYDTWDGAVSFVISALGQGVITREMAARAFREIDSTHMKLLRTYPQAESVGNNLVAHMCAMDSSVNRGIYAEILGLYYILGELGQHNIANELLEEIPKALDELVSKPEEQDMKHIFSIILKDRIGRSLVTDHIERLGLIFPTPPSPQYQRYIQGIYHNELVQSFYAFNVLIDLLPQAEELFGATPLIEVLVHDYYVSLVTSTIMEATLMLPENVAKPTGYALKMPVVLGLFKQLENVFFSESEPDFSQKIQALGSRFNIVPRLTEMYFIFSNYLNLASGQRGNPTIEDISNIICNKLDRTVDDILPRGEYFKYFIHSCYIFVDTLNRLQRADDSKSNSKENLKEYPLITSVGEFVDEYKVMSFPSLQKAYGLYLEARSQS